MNLARYFGNAVVRRCAYILAGLLVYGLLAAFGVGVGKAHAGQISCSASLNECSYTDRAAAYQGCQVDGQRALARAGETKTGYTCGWTAGSGAAGFYTCKYTMSAFPYNNSCGSDGTPGDPPAAPATKHSHTITCPVGTTWDAGSSTCFDGQQCLARNVGLGLNPPRPSLTTERCVAGCQFSMQAGYSISTNAYTGGSTNGTVYRGVMEYTGQPCGAVPPDNDPPPDDSPEQQCVPASAGQSFCIKPNGQHCYTASTGRQICWSPGETGEKGDGNVLQVRRAGNTPPTTPQTPPPPGEQFNPPGPTNVTTTTGTGVVNTVVNTTNFTTVNGTDAGGDAPPAGEPGDGSGTPDGETGGDNSSTGGVTCAAPPESTGDPLLAQIAFQAWSQRCGITVTPGDGCDTPPVCSENDALGCAVLLQDWKSDCDGYPAASAEAQVARDGANALLDAINNSSVNDMLDNYNEALAKAPDAIRESDEVTGDDFDDSGFLGDSSCPQLPTLTVRGTALSFSFQPFCSTLGYLGYLVVCLAYFKAFKLIT